MTIEEVRQNALERASKADNALLLDFYAVSSKQYWDALMNNRSQDSIDKAYERLEVYREELLKRLG